MSGVADGVDAPSVQRSRMEALGCFISALVSVSGCGDFELRILRWKLFKDCFKMQSTLLVALCMQDHEKLQHYTRK